MVVVRAGNIPCRRRVFRSFQILLVPGTRNCFEEIDDDSSLLSPNRASTFNIGLAQHSIYPGVETHNNELHIISSNMSSDFGADDPGIERTLSVLLGNRF